MNVHAFSGYNVAPPPTGNLVVYSRYSISADTQEIWGVPSGGGSPQQITVRDPQDYDTDPDMSSDGTQVVFLQSANFAAERLWIIQSDGTGETQLDGTANCRAPQWNHDGTKIVYKIGSTSFFTINPDGTGKPDVTPNVGTSPTATNLLSRPTWNRDSTLIGFQVSRTSGNPEELWVMNPDGTSPLKIATLVNTVTNGLGFSWMHGADTIVYTKGGSTKDVRKVNADGTGDATISDGGIQANPGAETVLLTALSRYAWSADDTTAFALQELDTPRWAIWSLQADASDDVALAAPLDDTNQLIGSGYPYIYNDRVYTVTLAANLVSTALDGTDLRTEDGDSGANLNLSFQGDTTGL